MCKIYEHICWHPSFRIVLPWRSKHVMTLLITRIEDEPLYVQLVCRDLRVKDTMFQHFGAELDKLEAQYAKPGQATARVSAHAQEGEGREPGQATSLAGVPSLDHEPWNEIPDLKWDRQALQLWWKGYDAPQISARLHVSAKTVRNRLSELRKIYSEEIVPTKDRLRELGLR